MVIDPTETYLHLSADGAALPIAGGEAFWAQSPEQMDAHGKAWLVTEYTFAESWANWEMHPMGDELVYLLEGEAEFHLELGQEVKVQHLSGRGLVVVPKGVWHTVKTYVPCRMLFVTMGEGTEHRPVAEAI